MPSLFRERLKIARRLVVVFAETDCSELLTLPPARHRVITTETGSALRALTRLHNLDGFGNPLSSAALVTGLAVIRKAALDLATFAAALFGRRFHCQSPLLRVSVVVPDLRYSNARAKHARAAKLWFALTLAF